MESDTRGSAPGVKDEKKTEEGWDSLEEGFFEVEKLEGHRRNKTGNLFYLVKWKNYDEMTWEPEESLDGCPLILKEYLERKKGIVKQKTSRNQYKRNATHKNLKRSSSICKDSESKKSSKSVRPEPQQLENIQLKTEIIPSVTNSEFTPPKKGIDPIGSSSAAISPPCATRELKNTVPTNLKKSHERKLLPYSAESNRSSQKRKKARARKSRPRKTLSLDDILSPILKDISDPMASTPLSNGTTTLPMLLSSQSVDYQFSDAAANSDSTHNSKGSNNMNVFPVVDSMETGCPSDTSSVAFEPRETISTDEALHILEDRIMEGFADGVTLERGYMDLGTDSVDGNQMPSTGKPEVQDKDPLQNESSLSEGTKEKTTDHDKVEAEKRKSQQVFDENVVSSKERLVRAPDQRIPTFPRAENGPCLEHPLPIAVLPHDVLLEQSRLRAGGGQAVDNWERRLKQEAFDPEYSSFERLKSATKLGHFDLFKKLWFEIFGETQDSRLIIKNIEEWEAEDNEFGVTLGMHAAWKRPGVERCTTQANHGWCQILSFLGDQLHPTYLNKETVKINNNPDHFNALRASIRAGQLCQTEALISSGARASSEQYLREAMMRKDSERIHSLIEHGANRLGEKEILYQVNGRIYAELWAERHYELLDQTFGLAGYGKSLSNCLFRDPIPLSTVYSIPFTDSLSNGAVKISMDLKEEGNPPLEKSSTDSNKEKEIALMVITLGKYAGTGVNSDPLKVRRIIAKENFPSIGNVRFGGMELSRLSKSNEDLVCGELPVMAVYHFNPRNNGANEFEILLNNPDRQNRFKKLVLFLQAWKSYRTPSNSSISA